MDIEQARAEYVTGKMTYSQIAAKYGVNKSYVGRVAKRDGWTKQRTAFRKGVADKAILSTRERGARQLARLMDSVEDLCGTIGRITGDREQFYRWRTEDGETVLSIADTRRLQGMALTVKATVSTVRHLYEIPEKMDERKDRREERRLKVLEAREIGDANENAGVILMPQPLEEEPEGPVVEV